MDNKCTPVAEERSEKSIEWGPINSIPDIESASFNIPVGLPSNDVILLDIFQKLVELFRKWS